jgi:hypothetical protein
MTSATAFCTSHRVQQIVIKNVPSRECRFVILPLRALRSEAVGLCFHDPEPGAKLLMYGQAASLPLPPGAARQLGIAFVHQHLGLVPSLSVLENLRLGAIATELRWKINWRREAETARATFDRFGLAIDPMARIADLPQVSRALSR